MQACSVEELAGYCLNGLPVWHAAELRVRRATAWEAEELQSAQTLGLARKEYEGYVFTFFVPTDAALR